MLSPKIAIVVILVIYALYQHQLYNHRDNLYEIKSIDDADLDTGDIILCKAAVLPTYDLQPIIKLGLCVMNLFNITCNYFTHVGIIIKVDGNPLMYHIHAATEYDSYSKKNINTNPRATSMIGIPKTYGKVYVHKFNGDRRNMPHISHQFLQNTFNKFANVTYQTNFINIVTRNLFKLDKHTDISYLCTDYVEQLLKELNIIDYHTGNADMTDILSIINCHQYDKVPILLDINLVK